MPAAAELETPPAAEPETPPPAVQLETPPAAESEAPADLLETVRALPPESQRAVLSFARFLRAEDERRIAADEAEWDRLFNDPVKMAAFGRWAEGVFATQTSEPFDASKL